MSNVVAPETYSKVSQVSQPAGTASVSDPKFWPARVKDGFTIRRATSLCCRFGPCLPNVDWHVGEFGPRNRPEGGNRDRDLGEILLGKEAANKAISNDSAFKTTVSDRWVEFIVDQKSRPMYIRENTDWFDRTFSYLAPGCKKTTYTVHAGDIPQSEGQPEGEVLFRHEKERTMAKKCSYGCLPYSLVPPAFEFFFLPCCFNLPYMTTYDARTNRKLGSSKMICGGDVKPTCSPKLAVYDANDEPVYLIRPNLCCFDQCEACYRCDALVCSVWTPCSCFYCYPPCMVDKIGDNCRFMPNNIYDYKTLSKHENAEIAYLTKLKEMNRACCVSNNNLYGVRFPDNINDDMRATLMGTTLLYEIAVYQSDA